jgi:hypothetical protein
MRYIAAAIAQGDILTPHSMQAPSANPESAKPRRSFLSRLVGR